MQNCPVIVLLIWFLTIDANQISLKQPYCRDLRDCQTYFPCSVFSNGFSYLYIIKRCSNTMIFDEKQQQCVKNTYTDRACPPKVIVVPPKYSQTSFSLSTPFTSKTSFKRIQMRTTKFNLSKINDSNSLKNKIKRHNKAALMKIKLQGLKAMNRTVLSKQKKTFEKKSLREVADQTNEENEADENDRSEVTTENENMEEDTTKSLATIRTDHASHNDNKILKVCYITNWSRYRTGDAKFEIEFIDPFLCTHIVYAYATVDQEKPEIIPIQNDDREHYRELGLLKKQNPDLKTSIRLGGKSGQYTRYLKRSNTAAQLVRSIICFDGVDLAMEFSDDDVPEDKAALVTLLEEIAKQKRLMSPRSFVSLTAAPFVEHLHKAYDVKKIEKLVNYINLMTFDFYGPWDDKTGVFAPLYHQSYQTEAETLRNVDGLVKLWISLGVPRSKIIIGIPAYGRSFSLRNGENGLHAPINGPGYPGRYTKTRGFLAYYEICEKGQAQNWQRVWLESEKSWYMTNSDQWISYEDVDSAALKAQYAKAEQLGGAFIWSIDNDEFSGFFCNTEPFPITRQVFSTLNLPVSVTVSSMQTLQPSPTAVQTVRFLHVAPLASRAPSISQNIPPNALPSLQLLLNALSTFTTTAPPNHHPPPVAHQTYNADYICGRHRGGIYRDRTNCSMFYFCEGEDRSTLRYHIFFCPQGLEFSMETCTCDWPNNRPCMSSAETFCADHASSPPLITTTTTPTPLINELSALGKLLQVASVPQALSTSNSFDCNEKRSGLYRDYYDCTKFYYCTMSQDGSVLRYDFACPSNYAFSMTSCRCEWSQNACTTLTNTDCLILS
ncbi:unnamed protein product [Didymodactylos carnosus]|uniref:Chitinase n=1 Tax=Didymodactylos carnosus TaxID=1234261 RepID=A0A813QAH7_9BILA|nr:unnamed protein product [Didymodactylos carnosus]CAF0858160.1 unnamed protein product [Didymodactylos carnosus]CAF3546015.1 unnamed protein product [Didymodactylos carnosus]CAF3643135.1 unnamed protein product [Didymodactylos carnosus]